MILCEVILIGVSTFFITITGGMCLGFYKSIDRLISQIKKLEDEILELVEKMKKVQMKILSLNSLSGLNDI